MHISDILPAPPEQQAHSTTGKFSNFRSTPEQQWRWLGLHATRCTQRTKPPPEYIALAVYDLESGDYYSIIINPKLHNPTYRLISTRLQGKMLLCTTASAGQSAFHARRSSGSMQPTVRTVASCLLCASLTRPMNCLSCRLVLHPHPQACLGHRLTLKAFTTCQPLKTWSPLCKARQSQGRHQLL